MAYESEFTKSLTAKKTTSGYESEFTKQLTSGTYQSVKIPTAKKKKTFLQKAVSTGKNLVNMVSTDVKNAVSNNYDAFTKKEETKRTTKTTASTGSGGNRMVVNDLDELYNAKNSMEKKLSSATTSKKDKEQISAIYQQTIKDIKAKESKGEKKTPTGKLIGKTAVSAATEFAKGVPSALEKVVDTTLNVATSKYNPYYWFNKDELASSQQIAEDLIKEDMTQNFLNVIGYGDKLSTGKTVQETLDTNSGLKSGSKEAQLIQGLGENVTTAFLGGLITGGMTGASKASKVAKEIVESIPFGATAYGGSLEEAYKGGADRQTANQYAALNTALELGTEKLYTAAGSILRTGGAVDDVLTKKITSKITNNLMQKLTKIGIGAVAEGGEELISEAINPLLKQMTYMSDTDLKTLYNNADFLNAFVGGAIGGLVLGSAGVALDSNTATDIVNQAKSQIENIANTSKNANEVKLAKKLIENPDFGIETATDQITQVANEIQNTNIPLKGETTTPKAITPSVGQQITPSNVNVPTALETTTKEVPKTVKVFVKSKFSDNSAYADVPVIRKEDNITLYQGTNEGENRQFWTPNKEYASMFGNVREKTGSFYKIDNGNRVTDVYVEAPTTQQTTQEIVKTGKLTQIELDELNTLKSINEVMELTNEEQKRYDTLVAKQKNEQNIVEKLKTKKQNDIVNKYNKSINTNVREITKKLNNVLAFDNIKQKDKFKKVLMDYASNNKKASYDSIKKDIEDNFAEKIISTTDETLKNIKRDVRQYKIRVDDYLKRSITDYNNFKKSNFGKLALSNEGQNVNSIYDELSDKYPYVFDKDVVNEVDQLNRLSDFMNEDITNVEKYNLGEDAVNEVAGYVKAFLDNKKDLNELINNIEISSSEVRRESIKENRYLAQKYIQEASKWKDTPILKQRTQTMKRNLRDIVGSQSEEMYNEYFAPISQHNADSNKFINNYNERIKKLELNTNEAIATQMVGELKYNPDTQLKDSDVKEFIKSKNINIEKVNNAVETFRNIYDELIVNINDTLKQYGLKEIDYRKGYFPHFIDQHGKTIIGKIAEKLGWKFNDGKLPTDIAGLTEMFSPNKKWTPFAQRRTGDLTEYNALKGFDNYVRGASNLIHHTGDIQKLNGLQNEIRYQHSDKGLQKDIDEIEGSKNLTNEEKQSIIDTRFENYNGDLANFVTNLKDYTDNIAGKKSSLDRGAESLTGRKIYNTIDNLMSRTSANMVGANLSSAITNFIPLTQAYSQINTPNMFKAMAQTISNQKRSDNFVNRSVYLTNRINETDKLYKTGLEKITDKAGILFKVVDNFTAETIVRGKYLENIKKGMTEQKAMNNADEFAKDVMAGRNLGDKPTLFNAKTNKLLTAFQLEVNNQYQYMFKDLPNDIKQEGTAKLILAFLKMFVGAWAYNQLAEKVTGRKSAFSPIDIITETIDTIDNDNLDVYDKVGKVSKNLLDELPFLGGLLGGGRIPISAAFPESAKVIESVSNLVDATKEESTKRTSAKTLVNELSKPLYYLVPPFGGGQAKKVIEGISMYTKDVPGSYTASGKLRFPVDKKALQVAQSVLFGQYASGNAKEYFDNGYAPLGDKQIQEYKDLGVDIKDYWKYRAGLSKQKSVEDKFNYISSTNFTDEQKNILINNAVDRKDKVDISNYKNYKSYDEFSYATDNPSDYNVSKQIATYDKYKKWTDEINFRKGLTSEDRKTTINYINSLPLTISQKALFIKKYYSSYDGYNNEIVKYVNGKSISKFEKATILKSVGFKSYDDYLINYVNSEKLTKEEKLNKLKDMGFTIKNGKVYK